MTDSKSFVCRFLCYLPSSIPHKGLLNVLMVGLPDKTYTLKAIDQVFGLQTKDPAMVSFQCYDLGLFEMWFVDSTASSGSLLEMRNHALSFTHRLERL